MYDRLAYDVRFAQLSAIIRGFSRRRGTIMVEALGIFVEVGLMLLFVALVFAAFRVRRESIKQTALITEIRDKLVGTVNASAGV